MTDVYSGTLSEAAQRGIDEWCRRNGRDDLLERTWWDFSMFCELWFRLRATPDDPEIFPKGKAATLQAMETMIDQALATEKTTVP